MQPSILQTPEMKVHYLWRWEAGEDSVPLLITSRKTPLLTRADKRLSSLVATHFHEQIPPSAAWLYPTRTLHKKDHASSLCTSLSQWFGGRAAQPVLLEELPEYKLLGRRDRLGKRKAVWPCEERVKSPVVFVDDVFTTGATALACWRALGRPRDFRVFVLAHKA